LAEIARLFPEGPPSPVAQSKGVSTDPAFAEAMRIAEALLFAAAEALPEDIIARRLPDGVAVADVLDALKIFYADRGVNLVRVGGKWMFRTAPDLAFLLAHGTGDQRKLSRAALETLAIIAYHQPVTRAEIEDIRGVAVSKGTIDVLLETGWIRLRGRRRAPGRPVTYGTTECFLIQFGLESIADLPGLEELRSAGLFEGRLPQGFNVPEPKDEPGLAPDEDPLDDPTIDCLPNDGPLSGHSPGDGMIEPSEPAESDL
jgi:segregation and condensation protein B